MGRSRVDARRRNHQWPDREIAELAVRQGTMVTHAQLRSLGVSSSSINDAIRWGRLHRIHHGVYSIVAAASARPRLAAEHAALLACGGAAVISHASAARVHGLRLPETVPERPIHLTVPGATGRGRGRPGLRVHRTRQLHPRETVRVGGVRVTSPARTVIDLAPGLSARGVEHLVDQGLQRVGRPALLTALDLHPRRPGVPRVRAVLDPARPSSDTWSRAEERLRGLLAGAGIPLPESNVPLGRLVPDMLWREWRVILEYDSGLYHSGPAGRRRTWERHNAFGGQGYMVIHVTDADLLDHRAQVLVRVAAALVRAGWSPGDILPGR